MVASRTTRWKHKVSSVSPECLERGYPGDCCRSCRTADHECGPSVTSASRWPLISASKQSSDYELGFFFTLKRFGELKSQSTRIWRLASEKNSRWVSRQAVRAEIQGWRIWEEVNGDMLAGIQLGVNEVSACRTSGRVGRGKASLGRMELLGKLQSRGSGKGEVRALVPKNWVEGDTIVSLQVITCMPVYCQYIWFPKSQLHQGRQGQLSSVLIPNT